MRCGNIRTGLLVLSVFVLAASSQPSRVAKEVFGDQQRLDSFLASQQVTAQRLHYRRNHTDPSSLDNYDKDNPVPVATAQAYIVQQLLQQPSSYPWDSVENCVPDYGVLLTFHNDKQDVRIALCFECDLLGVFDGNHPKQINSKEECYLIHTQLVAVAKAIFPNDSAIQGLK